MKIPFSNFKADNWKNLVIFALFAFYLTQYAFLIAKGSFPTEYGEDFLAFWSAGKVAAEKGFSQIYDLDQLRNAQVVELKSLEQPFSYDDTSFATLPSPYFSFFLLAFPLLSSFSSKVAYWIWTLTNFLVLAVYLTFYLGKVIKGENPLKENKQILLLMLVSFPVFTNLLEGQLNVLLLICAGEFLRNAKNKKQLLSGVWLAGLLLKPQLLILIVPVILILRYWRVLAGFAISSGAILVISILFSSFSGITAQIKLLTNWGRGVSITNPSAMINWRMIAVNLNFLTGLPIGWYVSGLGVVLTVVVVVILVKSKPNFGTSQWVMMVLGIFSATLALTWHAHYHMAMILIPFLIYSSMNMMLPKNLLTIWAFTTPITWLVIGLGGLIVLLLTGFNTNTYKDMAIALSGFLINLAILVFVLRDFNILIRPKVPIPDTLPLEN